MCHYFSVLAEWSPTQTVQAQLECTDLSCLVAAANVCLVTGSSCNHFRQITDRMYFTHPASLRRSRNAWNCRKEFSMLSRTFSSASNPTKLALPPRLQLRSQPPVLHRQLQTHTMTILWVPLATRSVTMSTRLQGADFFESKSLTKSLKSSVTNKTRPQRAISLYFFTHSILDIMYVLKITVK